MHWDDWRDRYHILEHYNGRIELYTKAVLRGRSRGSSVSLCGGLLLDDTW